MPAIRVGEVEVPARLVSDGRYVRAEFMPDTEGLDLSCAAAPGGSAVISLGDAGEIAVTILAVNREDYAVTCQVQGRDCGRCGEALRYDWGRRAWRHPAGTGCEGEEG